MASHYIIEGGAPGRERLRLLSSIFHRTTLALLQRAGIAPGMTCLDLGCGGGDVTVELAKLVGSAGQVTGTDIDEIMIGLARSEAEAAGIANVRYRHGDVRSVESGEPVDVIYARFLFSHLPDPEDQLHNLRRLIVPGGRIVVEDVDFSGNFCYPDCPAFWRHVELYTQTAALRGACPTLGARLPVYLREAGFEAVEVNVIQPAGLDERTKSIVVLTMERIAAAAEQGGFATREELVQLIDDLNVAMKDPGQLLSTPRVVQAWARLPA
jgi:ubiquinone/menaquinone biosynthesis C-methylase UbiE